VATDASLLRRQRPDADLHGIDIAARRGAWAEAELYDGAGLPHETGTFDVVLLVDVLHHSGDPPALLREAARVAGRAVIIKDHLLEGIAAGPRLRFMDRVGNRRFGVPLPYHYWKRAQWREAFDAMGLQVELWRESLGLYPLALRAVFDGGLHFIARFGVPAPVAKGDAPRPAHDDGSARLPDPLAPRDGTDFGFNGLRARAVETSSRGA
jgi:SAM-dependent methyltransferase